MILENSFQETPGFGLYIHWPFCVSKCPYCDFNSHVRQSIDEERWAQAYVTEFKTLADTLKPSGVTSIFFGGGTPSLMSPRTVEKILQTINQIWPFKEQIEITLEANPNSIEQDKFTGFKAAGINRLSVGIQSLNDSSLKFLGRAHGRDEALKALDIVSILFDRYSFDLIYARPQQTIEGWSAELTEALSYAKSHLSLYQLTLEKGTAFYTQAQSGRLHLPDEQLAGDFYDLTQEIMNQAGLPAYEVSNHAWPGHESRHNLLYWRCQDYGALGPGAHGRLLRQGQRHAFKNFRAPETWLNKVETQGHSIEEDLIITAEQNLSECLMMGLRLTEGVPIQRIKTLTGFDMKDQLDPLKLNNLIEEGYLSLTEQSLKATSAGRIRLNSVLMYLLS